MSDSTLAEHKSRLRRELKSRRTQLSDLQQSQAEYSMAQKLIGSLLLMSTKRVGLYFSCKGEIGTLPLIQKLLEGGKKNVFVPVISDERMRFQRIDENTPMVTNQFDIIEPEQNPTRVINPRFLDIVCVPLVGFDSQLNRLGMGGGFYDRTFAFRQGRGNKPFLLGIAHQCQLYEGTLPTEPWDIKLDAVLTDQQWYFPGSEKQKPTA
jgi:5-formyltetrahydrofolate cyclo-ligase